jgi:EAL domain-containing protein (putative c-di-GMP-specific phosphodiesterase class I)/ActR/RegA family two-component response regulator
MMGHLGRVLLVDDDEAMRRVCARILEHEGWTVVLADNGRAAIDVMGTSELDCIVSDVNMPELDGFGLVAAIRLLDPDIPVLLMTGDPSLHGAVRAIDSGAVSYLSKPFDHEKLASGVASAARRHGLARMRRRAESFARKLGAAEDRETTEQRFQNALDHMWMAFQPIIDLGKKRIFAFEALVRTEEDSLRRPDLLIATAERLGRIHELGRAIRTLVAKAAVDAPSDALLFVNVHGLELTDEQLYSPDAPLANLSTRVVLEITERVGIDEAIGAPSVAMLRKQGYRIAVDDLGAGYAALGALAMLEPEIVKLDMSLVRDLHLHPTKRRVVGAIATLCRELGSQVVAEGVETEAERETLAGVGIDLFQGYLFAKPRRGFAEVVF